MKLYIGEKSGSGWIRTTDQITGNKNGGHLFQYPPLSNLLNLDSLAMDTPHEALS